MDVKAPAKVMNFLLLPTIGIAPLGRVFLCMRVTAPPLSHSAFKTREVGCFYMVLGATNVIAIKSGLRISLVPFGKSPVNVKASTSVSI